MRPPVRHPTAANLVRSTAMGHRLNATPAPALVTHVKDRSGRLEQLLDDRVPHRAPIGIDLPEVRSIESFACAFSGVGFLTFTFSMFSGAGRGFANSPALIPVDCAQDHGLAEELADVGDPLPSLSLWGFNATRPTTSAFDGTVLEEYLIELPDPGERRHGTEVGSSFLEPARQAAELVDELGQSLSFIHAPACPPAPSAVPRPAAGPYLRLGVAVPRFEPGPRIELGAALIDRFPATGCGLWQRERMNPDNHHDFWQPLVPAQRRRSSPVRYWLKGRNTLALTCVGPPCSGATAAVLRMLRQAKAPLAGIAVTTLNDLTIINLVTHIDRPRITEHLSTQPADIALSTVLGLADWRAENALDEYHLMASVHPTMQQSAGPHVIWLTWSTPATSTALRAIVSAAHNAFMATIHRRERGSVSLGDFTPPNIEYLICRANSSDRSPGSSETLRGRMKITIDLDALESLKGSTSSLWETELGRFCSEVEERWREDLAFALGTRRIRVNVAWRESWIERWSSLHGESGR